MITVGFFAIFREITGTKEISVPVVPTIGELMTALSLRYGKAFRNLALDDGKISRQVNLLVNGKHIAHLQKDDTPLQEGDAVSVFPLIGGG